MLPCKMSNLRLLHRLTHSATNLAVACSQKKPSTSKYLRRPELDFDYILDPKNFDEIKDNVHCRKQIGDIDKVHNIWSQLEILMSNPKKNQVSEEFVQSLWDDLYLEAMKLPNRTSENSPRLEKSTTLHIRGNKPEFDFKPRPAEDLLRRYGFYRSDKVMSQIGGPRSYALIANLAHLQTKLITIAINKVELFTVTENDIDLSSKAHDKILNFEIDLFSMLGLHFRIQEMCSKELGSAAYRKFDIEAFMPGRNLFGEISSTSNCIDYQSRRLNLKYRDRNGNLQFAHTINGTAVASTRAIIAIVEMFQLKNWGLKLPPALQTKQKKKFELKLKTIDPRY